MDHEKHEEKEEIIMQTEQYDEKETTLTALKELKESSQQLKQIMNSLHYSLNELEQLSDFYDHTQQLLDWVYANCYVNDKGLFIIDKKEYTWLSFLKAYIFGDIKI